MTEKSYKDELLGVCNPEEPEKDRYPSDDSDFSDSDSDSEVDFGRDPKWKYNPLACMDYSCRKYSYIEQKENASDEASDEEFDELVKDVQEQMMRVMINEIDLARNTSSKK
jgi:hypothetical protein